MNEDVRRYKIFLQDILHDEVKTKKWMKVKRKEFQGRNAIDTIMDGDSDYVVLLIYYSFIARRRY